MTPHDFSDETLMAYADGELDPAGKRAVEAAIAHDPALAERVALFAGTRDALATAARARPLDPLPAELAARVDRLIDVGPDDEARVVPFPARPSRAAFFRPMAAAASIALVIGIGAGFLASRALDGEAADTLQIASLRHPEIAAALSAVPSGERRALGDGEIAVIASFANVEGEFCREFEFDAADGTTVVSVACHAAGAWEPRFAVVAERGDGTSYAPASSLETLDAYLMAIGAEQPLAAAEEEAALERLEP